MTPEKTKLGPAHNFTAPLSLSLSLYLSLSLPLIFPSLNLLFLCVGCLWPSAYDAPPMSRSEGLATHP